MTNKNTELLRLGLFLLITFSLTWIPYFICLNQWGYEKWLNSSFAVIITITMLAPALGNILTRLITKEGLWSDKLCFNFKGNLKYYATALLLPILFGVISVMIVNITYGNLSFERLTGHTPFEVITNLMTSFTAPVLYYSFPCFGEEYGWRGYMNDKLKSLTGTVGAVIIGGIIWGLWHAPLVANGFNFGKVNPFLSISLMCVSCIIINAICMYLTEKTGSVYPAVLLHTMLDLHPQSDLQKFFAGSLSKDIENQITDFQIALVLMVIIPALFGSVYFILLMRNRKNVEMQATSTE